ncbi:MAG: hypothetical protein ABFD65_10730 [Candidatus Polarisedimenticolia bacterium]
MNYDGKPTDLRVNVGTAFWQAGDGTPGGAPLSGTGMPASGVLPATFDHVSGVEGESLAMLAAVFPDYTRIRNDRSSLGQQILGAVSASCDEMLDLAQTARLERLCARYPVYEQGVVHQWNFLDATRVPPAAAASFHVDGAACALPMARDEYSFWNAPPTRFETTSCRLATTTVVDWADVRPSGVPCAVAKSPALPLYGPVYVEVRFGAAFVPKFEDGSPAPYSHVELRGKILHSDTSDPTQDVEIVETPCNGRFPSYRRWERIDSVRAVALDRSAQLRVISLPFNAGDVGDQDQTFYAGDRTQRTYNVSWRLFPATTTFGAAAAYQSAFPSGTCATTYLCATTYDVADDLQSVSVTPERWCRIVDQHGNDAGPFVDMAKIRWTKYLLLLDAASNLWVVDVRRRLPNLSGFPETTDSPCRIEVSSPCSPDETFASRTIRLDVVHGPLTVVSKYRWRVHHDGNAYGIGSDGRLRAAPGPNDWIETAPTGEPVERVVFRDFADAGSDWVFELEVVLDGGARHKTYSCVRSDVKAALGPLPLTGLPWTPTGLAMDMYGRPWVTNGTEAVRLVMRTDVGLWVDEEKSLYTREPYDEVTLA